MGLCMARILAKEGARLALIARTSEQLDNARSELESYGAEVHTYRADLTKAEEVNRVIAAIRNDLGPVDVLINNAGIIQAGPYNTMVKHDYEQSLNTHFWAPYYCTQAVVPNMRKRGAGRIVNIASIGGKISVPHLLPYSVGKFALVGYSEGLRAELLRNNVLVTTVCPGLLRTGSQVAVQIKGDHEAELTWFKIADALPLFSMEAEEAAKAIVEATRYGEAELVLSAPARILVFLKGLAPSALVELLSLSSYVMPKATPGSFDSKLGSEIQTPKVPKMLEEVLERAAEVNNEK